MSGQITQVVNINDYLEAPKVANRLSEKLGLEESKRFRVALSSAIVVNPKLMECTPQSLVNAAMIGHSLGLPPSPQLGYFFLVPYNNRKQNCKDAQFQLGYKGYVQLAMRSGYYKKLNVSTVKQGEFVSWNPLTEEIQVDFIEDTDDRDTAVTVGYCGYFEYNNGFRKMVYWTLKQMEAHADKYSQAYDLKQDKLLKDGKIPGNQLWKYSSFWYADFDAMAKKTVLRQMLSKWGSMSIDMQTAYEQDVKSDSVSYDQAQQNAVAKIGGDAGSEVIDADFEKQDDKTETPTSEDSPKTQLSDDELPDWTKD